MSETLRIVTALRYHDSRLQMQTVELHLKPYGIIGMNPEWGNVPLCTESKGGQS